MLLICISKLKKNSDPHQHQYIECPGDMLKTKEETKYTVHSLNM